MQILQEQKSADRHSRGSGNPVLDEARLCRFSVIPVETGIQSKMRPPPAATNQESRGRPAAGPFLCADKERDERKPPLRCRACLKSNEGHPISGASPPCSHPRGRANGTSMYRSRGRGDPSPRPAAQAIPLRALRGSAASTGVPRGPH
jgi:hypothetical protein